MTDQTTRPAPFRVEIREGTDGFTRALLAFDGHKDRIELARISTQPHRNSAEVQQAFISLAGMLVQQAAREAFPDTETTVVAVAPGASLDTPTH